MALKYTIFNPHGATLAIEEYGGGVVAMPSSGAGLARPSGPT